MQISLLWRVSMTDDIPISGSLRRSRCSASLCGACSADCAPFKGQSYPAVDRAQQLRDAGPAVAMESGRPLCDLPNTRKGTFELWIEALAERRERHTGPFE